MIDLLRRPRDGWRTRAIVTGFEHEWKLVEGMGPVLWFVTNQAAPRYRLVAIDLAAPRPRWREVVAQAAEKLEQARIVGSQLILSYLKDASSRALVFDLHGKPARALHLSGMGTASGFRGRPGDPETFYAFTSFNRPATIYRLDLASGQASVFAAPRLTFDPDDYAVEQKFYASKDGTRVPLFLVRRKELVGRAAPTLLYGYGGFDISLTPTYSAAVAAWLEQGGIYAVANLRGGGEYGADWHDAGTRTKKQNVFDDFIAAAEWLIANRYTSPPKLAIHGRSNGGLLVGAVMAQRPELFGAALPGVGVLDMLRYHTASANAYAWSSDYGTAEDPEEFRALLAYSPLHNLKPGRCYPPTLITTADHDDRVVPWHSFKFAAALQHAQGCPNPVLIRVEVSGSHGYRPTDKLIAEKADQWAFAAEAMGIS